MNINFFNKFQYMEGSITERQDPDGRIRRKGEMRLANSTYQTCQS